MMKYKKPTMELFQLNEEDVIWTSQIEIDPNPIPGEGEDGEYW